MTLKSPRRANGVGCDSDALTEQEIVKAFIDLYNMNNSRFVEEYPNQTLTLRQGIEYNLVDGQIVFDLDKIDILHYTHKEITAYQIEIRDMMDKQMSSYPEGISGIPNRRWPIRAEAVMSSF